MRKIVRQKKSIKGGILGDLIKFPFVYKKDWLNTHTMKQ